MTIRDRRLQLGMTMEEVGDRVGVSKSTIFRWEADASIIKKEYIERLAEVLKMDVVDIMEAEDNRSVILPVYGRISAGLPILASQDIIDYMEIPESELPSGTSFYLKVKGDSMTPLIPSGSHVLMRLQHTLENGEIGAFLVNGYEEAVLKRIRKIGDDTFLVSENEDYEPIKVNRRNPVKIVGKAISVSYDL